MILGVGHHVESVGQAVGVVEEGRDVGDVEDAGLAEAGAAQGLAVIAADLERRRRQLPSEVEMAR